METATANKINQTQNSFPAQTPGAVAECPLKSKPAETTRNARRNKKLAASDAAHCTINGRSESAGRTEKRKERLDRNNLS